MPRLRVERLLVMTVATKIAAVDFDDTLRRRGGLHEGERVEGSRKGMWWLHDNGYAIVIWSCSNWPNSAIFEWLEQNGYPEPHAINAELTNWETHSPKIVAHVYIDDRAAMWSGWSACIKWLKNRSSVHTRKAAAW